MKKPKPIPVVLVHEPREVPREHKPKDSFHMSVRQIENGFIVNRHGYRDGQHYDEEFFTRSPPGGGFSRPAKREQSAASTTEPSKALRSRSVPPMRGAKATRFASEVKAPSMSLNVPSDAPLPPTPKSRGRDQRLMKVKL